MNVVLDTNVFVSGIFFTGTPFRILKAWHSGQFILFTSSEIFNEYARVIREFSQQKKPTFDDKFIACALTVTAIIVTGDKPLLKTSGYKGLIVLTPAQFERQYLI